MNDAGKSAKRRKRKDHIGNCARARQRQFKKPHRNQMRKRHTTMCWGSVKWKTLGKEGEKTATTRHQAERGHDNEKLKSIFRGLAEERRQKRTAEQVMMEPQLVRRKVWERQGYGGSRDGVKKTIRKKHSEVEQEIQQNEAGISVKKIEKRRAPARHESHQKEPRRNSNLNISKGRSKKRKAT